MGRGARKWENPRSETFCPPPQDMIRRFASPFSMAKTSNLRAKTTSKLVVQLPPFSMAKTFSALIWPPYLYILTCPYHFVDPTPRNQ